jgi:hypothetical protein
MKTFVMILTICLSHVAVNSQFWENNYCINFEDQAFMNHLFIDTANFPGNIWQVGPPQKTTFNEPWSQPNAIVTDTVNFYPAGNNSAFILKNLAAGGFYYGLVFFNGLYYIQSDSLADYGKMEFSPDQGITWIDMINDTAYSLNFYWFDPKPVLTGNSSGWQFFEAMLMDIGSVFQIEYGDTLLFRFTFSSDNNAEILDGLMYDDICFYEMIEGITETRFRPLKTSIFPNPSTDHFTIQFDNQHGDVFQLAIYDAQSRLMLNKEHITGIKLDFSTTGLEPGVYYYKLTSCNRNQRGWGKFIVSE